MNQKLYDYLSSFITDKRKELIEEKILDRTRYITVVLEDVFQEHNASAVMRTCDCFGIQDINVIETRNTYKVNSEIALGASGWISIRKHNNTLDAIKKLKSEGYRIVATVPNHKAVDLEEFDLTKGKVALLFGTELGGLTEESIANADEYLKIPMYGFTESFNISVSAGIILHHLSYKMRKSNIQWKLANDEMIDIKTTWTKNTLKKADLLEKEFYKLQQQ